VNVLTEEKIINNLSVSNKPDLIILTDKNHLARKPEVGGRLLKLHKNKRDTPTGVLTLLLIEE